MAKRILDSALLIDWRAQRPPGSTKARGAWRVIQSAQIINWRAQLGPSSSGGGSVGISLSGEADGVSSATVELLGPPIRLEGEADGSGQAQCGAITPPTIHGESDGVGAAQIYLGGGVVSITCMTQGYTAGAATPGGSIAALADNPYSY